MSCMSHKEDSTVSLATGAYMSSCRICLSSIFDPAALTCGHRFCEGCLERYWQLKDKPGFLICPLCRGYAYDVKFAKKAQTNRTEESKDGFRKMFSTIEDLGTSTEISKGVIWCFKISILMPMLYFIAKWLKEPVAKWFSYSRLNLLTEQ